ncbi:MAG: hypothetical protein M1837_001269 [Sclerophora amabilis]|nr:MAG: hypothetical protein M1837_001269 [Sclerophora amabilis]
MSSDMPGAWKSGSPVEDAAGLVPSQGVSLDIPAIDDTGRPPMLSHVSTPAYQSPVRHHRRGLSTPRKVKETLNARSEFTNSEDDGQSERRINQYIIKQEIGRGSFGAVHLAIDQYRNEYAVKEFSKSRLRKRAQSNILRRPNGQPRRAGHLAAGLGFNSPLFRHDSHDRQEGGNPLSLIQEEIAIMKKLNHTNLVPLIEVLDDPEEDSLYMVLEMCKKGVIMRVGLEEKADGYDAESCRCWFRDLLLGIEYLHAQGVVHRDIKPDNCLLTHDDVLKVSDFGVSEMFEKQSEMVTNKSAGSPAFLPPELCVAKHGDISGKAADIWSCGVTLYCLRFGRLPFEKTGVLELYDSIRNDSVEYEPAIEPEFEDMMRRVLEKDPAKRITMPALKEHPWVTKNGADPLLSTEENISDLIQPPTEAEVNSAITAKLHNLLVVMKAVKKFKMLASRERPALMDSILGQEERMVQPPGSFTTLSDRSGPFPKSRSVDVQDRRPVEHALTVEGVHRQIDAEDGRRSLPHRINSALGATQDNNETSHSRKESSSSQQPAEVRSGAERRSSADKPAQPAKPVPQPPRQAGRASRDFGKGQAHDFDQDRPLILDIGAGGGDDAAPPPPPSPPHDPGVRHVVSESPPATDMNIYETAYQDEVKRIRGAEKEGHRATVYLTRRVDEVKDYMQQKGLIDDGGVDGARPKVGWHKLLEKSKARVKSE